jgi:hypothetical protein
MVMSPHPDQSATAKPKVLVSLEDTDGFRCVDVFQRHDGSFGFKEFRRDPEDSGQWTLVGDYSYQVYPTQEAALQAARTALPWFATSAK